MQNSVGVLNPKAFDPIFKYKFWHLIRDFSKDFFVLLNKSEIRYIKEVLLIQYFSHTTKRKSISARVSDFLIEQKRGKRIRERERASHPLNNRLLIGDF
jgi:hypothetical protein